MLSGIKKKTKRKPSSVYSLYVGTDGDLTVCMCHTLHLSCHKHSHNSLTGRDKQLTPSIKGLVIVGENTIKYLHTGLEIENV